MRPWALIFALLTGCGDGSPDAVDATPATIDAAASPDAPPDADLRAQCENGLDDDDDGRIDFPFDPECESPEGTDESAEAFLPACSDFIDNDGDGLIDFGSDPGCNSAADVDEYNTGGDGCFPDIIHPLDVPPASVSGEIAAGPNDSESATCGGLGNEAFYVFTVTRPESTVVISTDHPDTTVDTVLYVWRECRRPDTEIGCNDDAGDSNASTLVLMDIEVGTYFLVVDSFGPGSLGAYELSIEVM